MRAPADRIAKRLSAEDWLARYDIPHLAVAKAPAPRAPAQRPPADRTAHRA